MKNLPSLRRQFLDTSLDVGSLLVDELLQVLDRVAERRFHQDATGEHHQPRIAVRQPAQRFEPAAFVNQRLRYVRPALTSGEHVEQPTGFLRSDASEKEESEELVERPVVGANGFEDGIGRSEQKDFGTLDEIRTQRVNFALVAHLTENRVQVLDEQDQSFSGSLAVIHESGNCVGGDAFSVSFLSRQRVGSVCPFGFVRRAGQMTQSREPEVRQIDNPVAFLVEGDRLPGCGEVRCLGDRVQEP